MPEPTTITSAERRALKARAQHLEPVVFVGKAGITDAVLDQLERSLNDHELIKARFTAHKEDRHAMADTLAARSGAVLVATVGHVSVLFRRRAAGSGT